MRRGEIPASPEDQGDGISTPTDLCSLYRLMPAAVSPAGDGTGA